MPEPTRFDPYLHDPLHWGASMAHHAELMLGCLEAAGVKSVLEVGAYAGDLTRVLVDWAQRNGASVQAVDPAPQPGLVELAERHSELELIRRTSLEALPELAADAIVIDGDHNYYTVSQELRLIAERSGDGPLPLLFFHDVCWPHGRRDDYFEIDLVPPAYRQLPLVGDGRGIAPEDPGTRDDGLPYPRSAAHEGGERNGVLTAVRDFVNAHDGVRLAVVPAFFGFGVAWQRDAPWADAVAGLLGPWDQAPLVAALEANRVGHVAAEHALRVEIWKLRERRTAEEAVLRRMLESRAFELAEALSRLRVRLGIAPGQSIVSRRQIRRALGESE